MSGFVFELNLVVMSFGQKQHLHATTGPHRRKDLPLRVPPCLGCFGPMGFVSVYFLTSNIMMTVSELIRILKSYDPDSEVRIASQPRWPMEYRINDAIETIADKDGIDEDADDDNMDDRAEPENKVVYVVEGYQIGYLGGRALRDMGWD